MNNNLFVRHADAKLCAKKERKSRKLILGATEKFSRLVSLKLKVCANGPVATSKTQTNSSKAALKSFFSVVRSSVFARQGL